MAPYIYVLNKIEFIISDTLKTLSRLKLHMLFFYCTHLLDVVWHKKRGFLRTLKSRFFFPFECLTSFLIKKARWCEWFRYRPLKHGILTGGSQGTNKPMKLARSNTHTHTHTHCIYLFNRQKKLQIVFHFHNKFILLILEIES